MRGGCDGPWCAETGVLAGRELELRATYKDGEDGKRGGREEAEGEHYNLYQYQVLILGVSLGRTCNVPESSFGA